MSLASKPVVIIARMYLPASALEAALAYHRELSKTLAASVDGFEGSGYWQSYNDPTYTMIHYQYRDQAAAEQGLVALVDKRPLTERTELVSSPPDVLGIDIKGRQGRRVTSEVGDWLSISIRMADTGYGQDLCDELDRIFQEISVLDGFLGAEYGVNQTLEDQVVGLALWSSREAFTASVPPGTIYDVNVFRRLM